MRHTISISDVHLSEVERGSGLWMRYRQEPFSPDAAIAAMLGAVLERVKGDDLTLVLNGDVFDLDAPRVVGGESVFHDLPRDAAHGVPMMAAILRDHPVFVGALGDVLAAGHEVVLVSGNHDVQLTLPEVREVVRRMLLAAAVERGGDPDDVERRIVFRAWFHFTPDGILLEHGNQYDPYCSYRYPMAPFGKAPARIQPTLGSLATRNLISRMGYFNPHVDSSFMLSVVGYVVHWAKFYLFSRRSLAMAWAIGAGRTVLELARHRDPESRARRRANINAAARDTSAPVKDVARHARLFARPAEDDLGRVMRELWVDRAILVSLAAFIAGTILAFAHGFWLMAALVPLVALVVYELTVPKPKLEENWARVNRYARRVATVHRARAVVFGHTHRAEGAWERGVFYGNTGSWSAAYRDLACTTPVSETRPVVWLSSGRDGELSGGLVLWKSGRFEPAANATRPPHTLAPVPVGAPALTLTEST